VHRIEFEVMHALRSLGHQALVPFEEKSRRRPGSQMWVTLKYPLFSRYVFVGLEDVGSFFAARVAINAAASAKDLTLINESPLASLSSAPTPHESRKPEYMLTYNNYI
jgi:hypothetical protein